MKLTPKQAADIHEILVIQCGADPHDYDSFEAVVTDPSAAGEYRFGGVFGFGGKFYWSAIGWRVDYYQENESHELFIMKSRVNLDLNLLFVAQTPLGLISVALCGRYLRKYGAMVVPEFRGLHGIQQSPLTIMFREDGPHPSFMRITVKDAVIVERVVSKTERVGKRTIGHWTPELKVEFADPEMDDKLDARVDQIVKKYKEGLFVL